MYDSAPNVRNEALVLTDTIRKIAVQAAGHCSKNAANELQTNSTGRTASDQNVAAEFQSLEPTRRKSFAFEPPRIGGIDASILHQAHGRAGNP